MATSLERDYIVVDGQAVYLSVNYGYAQLGASSVSLDGVSIAQGGAISNLHLGKGEELRGKILEVRSAVADVSTSTNKTNVMYNLRGGVAAADYELAEEVSNDGNFMVYKAVFNFN